jgi:hypothetical protein
LKLLGEDASGFDGLGREIDPHDRPGAFFHPRHRIHTGVALEMNQTLARDPRGKLSEFNRLEARSVGAQPSAEFFVLRMDGSDCVPVGSIDETSLEDARRRRMCSIRVYRNVSVKRNAICIFRQPLIE